MFLKNPHNDILYIDGQERNLFGHENRGSLAGNEKPAFIYLCMTVRTCTLVSKITEY